jgi:PAS domain S-box-containing protein
MTHQAVNPEYLINSVPDGIISVNMDMKIMFINKAGAEILNVNAENAIGQTCRQIMNAEICKDACPLERTLKTGKSVINKTVCILPNKKRIPVSISTSLLRDEKGKAIGAVETFRDLSTIVSMKKEIREKFFFENMFGKIELMQNLFELINIVAQSDSTVLIEGESGTGKELIARAIHSKSKRRDKPLITVNCSALPETLLESELFGYVAGAFTDAKKDKKGRFALADGGILFLDEIGELSHMLQVKLLRVLQEKKYEPLGSTRSYDADVRIITATNKNMERLVREKVIREDFYYRINVIKIEPPPLRERSEDIPWLIDFFIEKLNKMYHKDIDGISPYALRKLMSYDFPGNVRELENIIEHSYVLCPSGLIKEEHLPEKFQNKNTIPAIEIASNLKELEAIFLISVLKRNNWSRKKAAEELGIDTSTLFRKLKRLGLKPPKK